MATPMRAAMGGGAWRALREKMDRERADARRKAETAWAAALMRAQPDMSRDEALRRAASIARRPEAL